MDRIPKSIISKIKGMIFWQKLLKIILALSLVPVLIIAFYNHGTSDDFSYGWMTRIAWIDTHSLREVLKAVFRNVKETYFAWQGTYSAVALFALQPGVWGENFYFLSTFIVTGLFVFSCFYLLRRFCKNVFECDTKVGDVIASVILLLSVQLVPSPAEAFFWWNGASYYVIFHALMLIFVTDFSICVYKDKCSRRQWGVLCLLGTLIAGGNYITILLTLEMMTCILCFSVYRRNKVTIKMLIPFFLTIIGFLINCFAPGNSVRKATYESWSPIKAILHSYYEAYFYMEEWLEPILILALVFLLPFLWYAVSKLPSIKIGKCLLALFITFSLYASSFTPTLYVYGEAGPGRIQNIRYFLWILVCIMFEAIFIMIIKRIVKECGKEYQALEFIRMVYDRYAIYFWVSVLVCVMCFLSIYTLADKKDDLTSIIATKSLISGEAREYDKEVNARLEILEGEEKTVYLSAYITQPELLFLVDIQEESNNWINCAVAKFYKKDEVRLKDD